MKWKKYTIHTMAGAEDIVIATLTGLGIEGVEIEDNIPLSESDTKGMFIDILPEMNTDDKTARISFYTEENGDKSPHRKTSEQETKKAGISEIREALNKLKEADADGVGSLAITESDTKDTDWINNWKQFFKPFTVDDILIKPTWEEIPEDMKYKILIQIDPGTAFGTGSHETTQLCIRALEKHIRQMNEADPASFISVLDVGTGSGILGIAALKAGAGHVLATDLDENAIEAVAENLEVNDISSDDFEVYCGNIIEDEKIKDIAGFERFDIAVANILAPVIIMLQKEVFRHIKHGGLFIASGIIDMKEEEVLKAIRSNPEFDILEVNYQGEWVGITARRK